MKKLFSFPLQLLQIRTILAVLIVLCMSKPSYSQNVVVSGALSGNGTYPDLNSAFTAINSGAQTAASITVDIVANTTETVSAVLNAGAWTSVSITPSGSALRIIAGNLAAPLVDLNGADNVFFNGLNTGGNSLTISNANTGNVLTTTFRFRADAQNNVLSNLSLEGSETSLTLGVITFSTGSASGNSFNLINNCNIGPAGANQPVNGIYSAGASGFDNSSNVISNCRVFDYFSTTLATHGIAIEANNTQWLITGNQLYQTAFRTYASTNTHRGIQVGSGTSYTVSNNFIGGANPSGSGTYSMSGTVATLFTGINIAAGTTGISSVQGNTISGVSLATSSSSSTATGILCGINIASGNANVGNLSANVIGSTSGTNLFNGTPSTTGGMVVGINSASTGTVLIENNIMGAFTCSNTSAAITGAVTGINVSGLATGLIINGNIIGNTTTDNMRAGTNGLTTANSVGVGIRIPANLTATNVVISNNLVRNIACYGTGTGSCLRGIWTASASSTGIYSILTNTVINLITNSSNVAVTTGQVGAAGIILATGTSCTVSGNYVANIANTGTATGYIIVAGISNANGTNTVFRFNRIYDLRNTCPGVTATTPPIACGFFIRSGTNGLLIHNNMISLGGGQTSNTAFMGICGNHGSSPNPNVQVFFNTINIEGTASSGAHPSFGIGRTDFSASARLSPYEIMNNLITNTRTGGTGAHYAIGNNYGATASATGWVGSTINNNVLNANPATVGWWNSALTFAGWKAASGGDANSHSGITVTYSNSASDLHLNMGLSPTYIESGAQNIPGISVDIDSQVRPGPLGSVNGGALFPDIGADEIDGVLVTCTSAIGGTITPASGNACAGQTVAATSMSASSGLGTVYQWQVGASPGGPYTNVTGGSGATTTSYTSAPLPQGVYYVVMRATCTTLTLTSVSNEVTLTVNATPSVSASSTSTFICSTQSINLSASPGTGTLYSWSGPNGFSSTAQNTVITNASINASGNYSFTSSANTCTSQPAIVSVTVNATPTTLTLTPVSSTLCAGSSQSLTVSGGDVPGGQMTFTPQTNQNSATTYPAPYSVYWGGQKMQFLILASELTASGLVAGPLTSIQFPVVSKGANWGTSITSCQSFQVSLGLTSITSVGATFQTGLTTVGAATNFTPNVGYGNIHGFSPTFVWDGTSNLIVETVFSNVITGATADAVISYNSPTTFQSTMVYRADGATFATIAAATTTNEATNLVRPDFILKGQMAGSYTWSPAAGLSTTTGSVVNATPAANSVYTVMVSTGLCSTSTDGTLAVVPMPTLSIASSAATVCAGESTTLTASGADSFTWSTISTATNVVVTPSLLTTVYTVSNQTLPCPVATASVTITANPLPTLSVVPPSASVCANTTVTLLAAGAGTYSWSNGPVVASQTVTPSTNTVYVVSGTNAAGCSSSASVAISTYSLPIVTVAPASYSACVQSQASFTASGASSFSWSTGSQNANTTVTVTANAVYTVTGYSSEGCSGANTVSLTANPLPTIITTPASATLCTGETLTVSASGAATYTWLPINSGSASISLSPTVSSTYTVNGTDANNCSNSSSFTVTVDECTGIHQRELAKWSVDIYPNPSTGLIHVAFAVEGEKIIRVNNSLGAEVDRISTQEPNTNIDLSGKAKGVYFLNVTIGNSSSNYRVIIQ